MTEEVIIFEPGTPISPEEVKKSVSGIFGVSVVAALIGIYLFRKYDTVPVVVGLLGIGSLFIGSMKRFPRRLIINTRLKMLKADYLDAFGKEKSMYIDLTKANFSRKPRSNYSEPGDDEIFIYQNIFSNFIRINRLSHFSEAQLEQIYSCIKSLKQG